MTVAAPLAMAERVVTKEPRIIRGANSARIVHRERLANLAGSVAFSSVGYALNPGLASTFKWLSTQASGWEQYRFHRLAIRYHTRLGATTAGSVYLAADYDAQDPPPATEDAMSSYLGCVEDSVWKSQLYELNTQAMFPIGPRKFIRSSAVAGDKKTFDAGNFFAGTVGEVDTSDVGKLWIEYDVEFFVPQTVPSAAASSQTSVYVMAASQALSTGVYSTVLWDAAVTNPLGISLASGVLTPPAGAYIFEVDCTVSDTAAETLSNDVLFRKNGSAINPRTVQTLTVPAGGSSLGHNSAYIVCNGTDTVDVRVGATGAAGTLAIPANSSQLRVRVA